MRCKKHPSDLSCTVGVCASCLRERLFSVIAAQSQAQIQTQQLHHHHQNYPPLFPRSVSPYISNRKSDASTNDHHHHISFPDPRFFSTPQLGGATTEFRKKKGSKFSLLANFFRFRSDKSGSSDPGLSRDPCSASATTQFSGCRRSCRRIDRGMSPERTSYYDGVGCEGPRNQSPEFSGRSPAVATHVRRGRPSSNSTGLAFCLSPLVRVSPSRQWSQKSLAQSEIGYSSGEVRVAGTPHFSLCANRSRKMSDFGRVNRNR